MFVVFQNPSLYFNCSIYWMPAGFITIVLVHRGSTVCFLEIVRAGNAPSHTPYHRGCAGPRAEIDQPQAISIDQ